MGGNAFRQILPDTSFPRMTSHVYKSLKASLMPRIEDMYELAAVPAEAPGKVDYGDLDFVVSRPRADVTLEMVKNALGAVHSIPFEGNRTSHFAVPAAAVDRDAKNARPHELEAGSESRVEIFHQIDVNVCADESEWERTVFLHSYGDMGMILSLLARGVGLTLSLHGLKLLRPLPTNPPITFFLSFSLNDILAFYGLSRDRWAEGFTTEREVFDWVASSRLFDVQKAMRAERNYIAGAKQRAARSTYQRFLEYTLELVESETQMPSQMTVSMDDVLRFFGKKAEHDALINASLTKAHARKIFAGKLVEEWTGLKGMPVKWLMDTVRERLAAGSAHPQASNSLLRTTIASEDDENGTAGPHVVLPWESVLFTMSGEEVHALTIAVKDEMDVAGTFDRNWEKKKREKRDASN